MPTDNKNIIRTQNTEDIKKVLFRVGKAVASELGAATNVSMVTVHSILKDLLKEGSISEGEMIQKGVGRPALEYKFEYDYQLSLHISLIHNFGKATIIGEVVNLFGDVKERVSIDLVEHTRNELANYIEEIIRKFSYVHNIGIMIPGKIHRGKVLSGWEGLIAGWDMEDSIREYTDKPLYIQNDAHLITVGYCIKHNIPKSEMIIGIYYPSNSHPGITIYTNGDLIGGRDSLAGEAKYFPDLMYNEKARSSDEMMQHMIKFLPFYNAALAPHRFILILNEELDPESEVSTHLNQVLKDQINHPKFEYIQNYFPMSRVGLRWLIYKDSIYEL